jgi:hypothetical protein
VLGFVQPFVGDVGQFGRELGVETGGAHVRQE